jgi:hypothetical protein
MRSCISLWKCDPRIAYSQRLGARHWRFSWYCQVGAFCTLNGNYRTWKTKLETWNMKLKTWNMKNETNRVWNMWCEVLWNMKHPHQRIDTHPRDVVEVWTYVRARDTHAAAVCTIIIMILIFTLALLSLWRSILSTLGWQHEQKFDVTAARGMNHRLYSESCEIPSLTEHAPVPHWNGQSVWSIGGYDALVLPIWWNALKPFQIRWKTIYGAYDYLKVCCNHLQQPPGINSSSELIFDGQRQFVARIIKYCR